MECVVKIEVKKAKMTEDVIRSIVEIDKEFYTNFDYNEISWYFDRYNDKNEVFLLLVNNKIVGYFLFVEISKSLFNDILKLKYDNDYIFPVKDFNCKTGYFYIPSVLVKKEFCQYSLPLLKRLFKEAQTKTNLVAITVSKEGHKMAKKILKFVGAANKEKDVRVYGKN